MMALRPIVIDLDGTILGGNMRFRALLELGYKEIPDAWVKRASDLTDDEKQRFIIEDNVGFGDWDWDKLANEWEQEKLDEWGLDLMKWDAGHEANSMTDDDVDLSEEFDNVGKIDDYYRVTFIFENEKDADSWLLKQKDKYDVQKLGGMQGKRSLINLSVTYGK